MGKTYEMEVLDENSFEGVDIAFFSAGGSQSEEFCKPAAAAGAVVIDNSSAFRMHPDVPLVVPEINPEPVFTESREGIIANPNCSTILMNMAVYPLYKEAGLERVVVSTYQAASGAGAAAMDELEQQARDWVAGDPLDAGHLRQGVHVQRVFAQLPCRPRDGVQRGGDEDDQGD